MEPPENGRLLRRAEVEQRIGLTGSTIYLRIAQGTFPSRSRLACRRCAGAKARLINGSQSVPQARRNTTRMHRQSRPPSRHGRRSERDRKHDQQTTRPASRGSFFSCSLRDQAAFTFLTFAKNVKLLISHSLLIAKYCFVR
jgi:predicted DNA-binding transcriptional regulator AlpA